jgi:hypothetical protein
MAAVLLTRRPAAVGLPKLAPVGGNAPTGNFTAAWPMDTFESVTVGWCWNLDGNAFSGLPQNLTDYAYRCFVERFVERFEEAIDGLVRPLDTIAPPPEALAAINAAWIRARADMLAWTPPKRAWGGR